MGQDVQKRKLGNRMNRPADSFFRLLEGLRLGQLHEDDRASSSPGQLDAKIPAVGGIAR